MKNRGKSITEKQRSLNIIPFALYINDKRNEWGFDLLNLTTSEKAYCLLRIAFLLPNAAERANLMWRGDFLFLANLLHRSKHSHWSTIALSGNRLLRRLKKVLQKINWKMRRSYLSVIPVAIYLNDKTKHWGIAFLDLQISLKHASLLALYARPFKRAERTIITWSGDVLFLRGFLINRTYEIGEELLWNPHNVSKSKKVLYRLLVILLQ